MGEEQLEWVGAKAIRPHLCNPVLANEKAPETEKKSSFYSLFNSAAIIR